jgi:hypothetical protein
MIARREPFGSRAMIRGRSISWSSRATLAVGVLIGCLAVACKGTPTQPQESSLPTGRWTGNGACLSVTSSGCDLVAGCGHGQFPPPTIGIDGTFTVQGTFRIEIGPVSVNPPPPALFSGVLSGQTVTITVTPSDPSLRPASYTLQLTGSVGQCAVPCV